ncbi:hypothetical protein AcV5_001149 [Taiwanofungus camphoratus]|nr:hypothetical protein AcV5_001149 [Antrodia cinnamomea]
MNNSVAFPTASDTSRATLNTNPNSSALSLAHHSTAIEVCDIVYGPSPPSWEAIERFYEPNAQYENPLITATSRAVIADIHAVTSRLAHLGVPKPAAVLYSIFGFSEEGWGDSWFKAMTMWNEVTDVSESDSFDGHRRTIIEHILHIQFLPGLQRSTDTGWISHPLTSEASQLSLSVPHSTLPYQHSHQTRSNLGQSSSPLHLHLPIITRLSFNDAGRITHHRDFWDIKDVFSLLPGMSLAQWITTRVIAHSIQGIVGAGRLLLSSRPPNFQETAEPRPRTRDEEKGLSPAASYAKTVQESMDIRRPTLHYPQM